jgi:imidazoleglycerol-phosphate dehydratase
VGFYDHMLASFGRHALFDLTVQTEGDTHIDAHHTVEDTAIVLGGRAAPGLGDKSGIRRFGDSLVPSTRRWCSAPSTCRSPLLRARR